jgi:DNA-binding IscR family transcriptional regulator
MVATRFAVAAHILLLIATASLGRQTSGRLAESVNTNPVVIRRITGQLARAGLVRVRRGAGGAELARPAGAIALADIWRAVHPGQTRPTLTLHPNPNPSCIVGRSIHRLLREAFDAAEQAMEASLERTTLEQLLGRLMGMAA